jgi:hypothetical protein
MQLQNRGVYRFSGPATSLHHGLELIADRTLHGYALYTPAEWDTPGVDPRFVVDPRGRILDAGAWTGYTVEVLVPLPDAGPAVGPGRWPLVRFARPRRHHRGTTLMAGPGRA